MTTAPAPAAGPDPTSDRARTRHRSWPRVVAGQVLSAVVVLLLVSVVTFALGRAAPGSTADTIAVRQAGQGAGQEQVDRIRQELRLDDPLPAQYAAWLGRAVTGDLGQSERTGRPVVDEVAERLPRTLGLGLGAAALAMLVGTGAGVAAAVIRRGPLPGLLRAGALTAVSVPAFWLSFLLIWLLCVRLHLLPTSGMAGPASWLMPCLVLAAPAVGTLSRAVAVATSTALARPFVTAARARGVPAWSPVLRDALPHALLATLDVTAVQIGLLLTGSVVVENVFGWPGLGAWFVDAVSFRDQGAVLAAVLVFAVAFIAITRGADLLRRLLDPRLRRGTAGTAGVAG